MLLILNHPEVAYRDCDHCKRFMYNHKTGEIVLDKSGQPVPRPDHVKGPPCAYHPKACAKGNPTSDVDLNETNARAYEHYLECRAVGHFPDDPIVKRNARVLREIEDHHHTHRLELALLAGSATKR